MLRLRSVGFSVFVQRNLFILSVLTLHSVSSVIQSPPRIVLQPPSDEIIFQVVVRADENQKPFLIPCMAEGEPEPQYKWLKNGKEFNYQVHDLRISRQPGRGTLVFTDPKDEDTGQYQCLAINQYGVAMSNSVFIRKAELESFTDSETETYTADEGKPYNLPCRPPDGYPKPEVSWLMQNQLGAIKSISSSRLTTDPEGTLWFSGVTKDDKSTDYLYTCSAFSRFRNEYKLGNRVHLNVIHQSSSALAPVNKYPLTPQYMSDRVTAALRGQDIQLWCIIAGTPLPEIKWTKRGGTLPQDRIVLDNYGKTLRILRVDFSDEGTYYCDASNGVGSPISYSISLEVNAGPFFTVEPEIANAAESETVEINCKAQGKPEPTIKWIHNGKAIEDAPPNPRRTVVSNKITIRNVAKSDIGNYGCNASNSLGYVYKDVYVNVIASANTTTSETLDVEDIPNAPVLLNVDCRRRDARISWKPTGDNRSPVLHYTIQYSTNFTPDLWEVAANRIPATDTSYTVSLSPWTNYVFRVIAGNKYRQSLPSSHSSACNTPADVPFRNPENVRGEGTEPDNLRISWTKMSEIEHNGPKFKYNIHWKHDDNVSMWKIEKIDDWRVEELIILNQPSYKPYLIRVRASNEMGDSNISPAVVRGYSGQGYPSEAPTNFRVVTRIDQRTLLVSWNPVRPHTLNGKFEGYKIQTWSEGEEEHDAREIFLRNDVTQAVVDNLTPGSRNSIRIRAYNTVHNGPSSRVVEIASDGRISIASGSDAFNRLRNLSSETGYNEYEDTSNARVPNMLNETSPSSPDQGSDTPTCKDDDFSREEQKLKLEILEEKLGQLKLQRERATIVYEEQMSVLELQRSYWINMSSRSSKCTE